MYGKGGTNIYKKDLFKIEILTKKYWESLEKKVNARNNNNNKYGNIVLVGCYNFTFGITIRLGNFHSNNFPERSHPYFGNSIHLATFF